MSWGALGGALIGNEMDKQDRADARRDRDYDTYTSRRTVVRTTEVRADVVTRTDVIEWTRRGDRDEQIIDRIERSASVPRLTARDENDLRDAGVSERVILSLKDAARR